jgi:hypothetical protein
MQKSDARVHCTQPTQVLVLYGPKELRTENSNKVKVRKVYLPRRESKRLLFKLRNASSSWVRKLDTLRRGVGRLFLFFLPWFLISPRQLCLDWGLLLSQKQLFQDSGDLYLKSTILAPFKPLSVATLTAIREKGQ